MWNASRNTIDGEEDEEDPFVGDLRNWEFLTTFFDQNDFLDDRRTNQETAILSAEEMPNSVSSIAQLEYQEDTCSQQDARLSSYSYALPSFISQPTNSDQIPVALLGDVFDHQYGVQANNYSFSTASFRFQDPQSIVDRLEIPYQGGNWGMVQGEFRNEPIQSNQVAPRLDVHRIQLDIGGFENIAYPSGERFPGLMFDENLESVHIKGPKQKAGIFFDYSPPLPNHDLLKPLTAYNFFYRDERDNIIGGMQFDGDAIPPAICDFSETKLRQLLHQRWYVDPGKKKRSHRKTHGKLPFET